MLSYARKEHNNLRTHSQFDRCSFAFEKHRNATKNNNNNKINTIISFDCFSLTTQCVRVPLGTRPTKVRQTVSFVYRSFTTNQKTGFEAQAQARLQVEHWTNGSIGARLTRVISVSRARYARSMLIAFSLVRRFDRYHQCQVVVVSGVVVVAVLIVGGCILNGRTLTSARDV